MKNPRPKNLRRIALSVPVLAAGLAFATLAGFRALAAAPRVERYGMVIGVKPEKIAEYKRLHAAVWPGVLKMIRACNIRNYSIYLREIEPGKFYLFSYFEYTGDDFAADMKKMGADPTTQAWWKETDPCQIAIPLKREGEFWSRMDEVFHTD
jgi:L-rhamnose mutarotase